MLNGEKTAFVLAYILTPILVPFLLTITFSVLRRMQLQKTQERRMEPNDPRPVEPSFTNSLGEDIVEDIHVYYFIVYYIWAITSATNGYIRNMTVWFYVSLMLSLVMLLWHLFVSLIMVRDEPVKQHFSSSVVYAITVGAIVLITRLAIIMQEMGSFAGWF